MAKILVVDDDKVMLGLLKTLMELEGNEVVTASRPEMVVPTVKENDISLILMDYYLGGANSMNALRDLKSSDTLKDIPVLMTSGLDRQLECIKAGANGFIQKPFRPVELLQQIQEILDQTNKPEAAARV